MTAEVVALGKPRKRVRKSAGSHAIFLALRRAVVEQALQPGAKLPEDAIGASFGVSRTIVRDALRQLAAAGLVEIQRNRGARVARPSWDEARDIFDVRIALERLVVARLAGRLSPEQIRALEDHAGREEVAQGRPEPESIRLATEFHLLLAELTGSEALTRYVDEVAWRCALTLTLYSRPHSSECGVSEHREIIAALAAGDEARASSVMERHLKEVAARALIRPRATSGDLVAILRDYAD